MKRQQNAQLLGMVGLGTTGGQARADGSTLERGIHLRWQINDRLGFPSGGFDIYRRDENLTPYTCCSQLLVAAGGSIRLTPATPGMTCTLADFSSSGAASPAAACGSASGAFFSGDQTVTIEFGEPVRYVSLTLDAATPPMPHAAAFWRVGQDLVLVAEKDARAGSTGTWSLEIFADQVDRLVLTGTDLLICTLCSVRVFDGYDLGWGTLPLNGTLPIYLPITNPEWFSPHAHTPDDQAEAEARLPLNLSPDTFTAYASGFADELHTILYDLVGTQPQYMHKLSEIADNSPASLQWPGLKLLLLAALDPNLARILGQYWLDLPPKFSKYYDYRVVAHYGQFQAPGRSFHFNALDVGDYFGSLLALDGVTYTSANPLAIAPATWNGSSWNALSVASNIPNAPLTVQLPPGLGHIFLRAVSQADLTVRCFAGVVLVMEQNVAAGEVEIGFTSENDISALTLECPGGFALLEISASPSLEFLLDLEYVSFHHRIETPFALAKPVLDDPVVSAVRTGLGTDGTLQAQESQLDLRWSLSEAAESFLLPGAPIFYQVQRAERGNAARPAPLTTWTILNEDHPALISSIPGQAAGLSPKTGYASDRGLADGWYSYQVRGIDLFGRLGSWSLAKTTRVQDHLPPPAPQAVRAAYLDPLDPFLGQADREWTAANGPGLMLAWEWAGSQRMQAPDVLPPAAEFRIYTASGPINSLSGTVTQAIDRGSATDLVTDINWKGAADDLAGEVLRVNGNFFPVLSNTAGPGCILRVTNLAAPALAPLPGPCSLAFTPGRSYWIDYTQATSWDRRLSVLPAEEIPLVTGFIQSVSDFDPNVPAVIVRPGASRSVNTGQALEDVKSLLTPGVLLCDGVVYSAYGHSLGNNLLVHIFPQPGPAEAASLVEPPIGAAFTYYPGRKYEMRIPGFNLPVEAGSAAASAQVAVSCSDGKAYIADNPFWSKPGKGGLGKRAGNEGAPSRAASVRRIQYAPSAAPGHVPQAGAPVFARPADYFGQARYTLNWEAVPQAASYAVYRCSGAALFDHDRSQRAARQDYYAALNDAAIFADDLGFNAWLAAYDPALTLAGLLDSPDAHLDAWRSWAARFYPTLSDAQVQSLANRSGSEKALRRVNKDPVPGLSYTDSFDGRGQGLTIYRVRAIDAASNLGAYSAVYPPVHIYDVTPPATPVVTEIHGGENSISLAWRANQEKDLKEYWIWRSEDPSDLSDIRRAAAYAVVVPTDGALIETWLDSSLNGGQTFYFRLAAVDNLGNRSFPTRVYSCMAYDMSEPVAPVWERFEWVRINPSGNEVAYNAPGAETYPATIALQWLAVEPGGASLLERRIPTSPSWVPLGDWSLPENPADPNQEAARRFNAADQEADPLKIYEYRVRFRDPAGNLNRNFEVATVTPPVSAG